MFEVEYLWNGWVKKGEANANLVLCDWLNFVFEIVTLVSRNLHVRRRYWVRKSKGARLICSGLSVGRWS